MMNEKEKQRLLQACVDAQKAYEDALDAAERLKVDRRSVFLAAAHAAVPNSAVAKATGLSNSQVGNILRGRR